MHHAPVHLTHVAATVGYRVAIGILVLLFVASLFLMLGFPLVLHLIG